MTIALDVIMIGLLIALIIRMIDVNKKIKNLKNLDGEISPLLRTVSESLTSSSAQIELLKKTTQHVDGLIVERLEKAKELKSDLEFMISHGNKTADRLESLLQEARSIRAQKQDPIIDQGLIQNNICVDVKESKTLQATSPQKDFKGETKDHHWSHSPEDKKVTTKAITKDSIRLMLMEKFQDGARKNA